MCVLLQFKLKRWTPEDIILECIWSGFNTDYKSSEPLKTLVMLRYIMLYGRLSSSREDFIAGQQ